MENYKCSTHIKLTRFCKSIDTLALRGIVSENSTEKDMSSKQLPIKFDAVLFDSVALCKKNGTYL